MKQLLDIRIHRYWLALVCGVTLGANTGLCAMQDISVTLKDALGSGKDISLFLAVDDGKVAAALGHARRYNKTPHQVDASGLQFDGDHLAGPVVITIASDGWVPAKGANLVADVSIDARVQDGRVQGTYELKPRTAEIPVDGVSGGKLDGKLDPVPDPGRVFRAVLNCRSVVRDPNKPGKGQGIGVALAFRRGRTFAARMIPYGSITDVALTATAEKHDVRLDGRRLQGRVSTLVRKQEGSDEFNRYDLELDGFVVAGQASGLVKVTRDGTAIGTEPFDGGLVENLPGPENALYKVTLHRAIPRHHHMNILFSLRDGVIVGGFAVTPHFNNAIHTVDFSQVRLDGNRLLGALAVTINPDPWIPLDHKPVACRYKIDAALKDGEVMGEFSGSFGGESVSGPVEGCLDPKPSLEQVAGLTLKVEEGVFGEGMHGRLFMTMVFQEGKLVSSHVGNNHVRAIGGAVDMCNLDWSGEKIRGTIRLRTGRGEADWKSYTCEVDGVLVGTVGAGAVRTVDDASQKAKPSTFWAVLTPVNR